MKEEEINKLKVELESYIEREEKLEVELLDAREQATLTNEHLEESIRQLDLLKVEMGAADEHNDYSSQLTILHSQRAELALRVRRLLNVNGKLRSASTTLWHQIERKDRRIDTLEQQVTKVKDENTMGEAMLQRQIMEWQNRARSLEQQLRDSERVLAVTRKRAKRVDTQKLRRTLEELRDENATLHQKQESQLYSWTHEKNLMKRSITSLEDKLAEAETQLTIAHSRESSVRKSRISKSTGSVDDLSTLDTTRNITLDQSSVISDRAPQQAVSSAEMMLREQLEELEDRLRDMETQEAAQAEEIRGFRLMTIKAKSETKFAQERAELLQSYLDVSLMNQPSKDGLRHELVQKVSELEQKHESVSQQREQSENLHQRLLKEKTDLSARQRARIQKVKALDRSLSRTRTGDDGSEAQLSKSPPLQRPKRIIEVVDLIDRPPEMLRSSIHSSSQEITRSLYENNDDHGMMAVRLEGLEKRCSELVQENKMLLELSSQRNEEIKSLRDRLSAAMKESDDIRDKIALLETQQTEGELASKAAEDKNLELQETLKRQVDALMEERESLQIRISDAEQEAGEFIDKMAKLEVERRNTICELQLEKQTLSEQLATLSAQFEAKTSEVVRMKEIETQLRTELESKIESVSTLESEQERFSAEISLLSSQLEETTRARTQDQGTLREMTTELAKIKEHLRDTKESLGDQQSAVTSISDAYAVLKIELDEKCQELDTLQVTMNDLEKNCTFLREALADKDSSLQLMTRLSKANEAKLQEKRNEVAQLETLTKALEEEKLELTTRAEERFASACTQLNELEIDATRSNGELASLEKVRDGLSYQIEELQQELERARSKMRDMEVITFWTKEKLGASEQETKTLRGELETIRVDYDVSVDRCKSYDSLQESFRLLTIDRDELEKQLNLLRGELEEAMARIPSQEIVSSPRSLPEQESNMQQRCSELKVTLQGIQTELGSITCERDRLNVQQIELQKKLEIAEAKNSELQSRSESVQVRSQEEIGTLSQQIKGLEETLHLLKSEHESLGYEKDDLQGKLHSTTRELQTSMAMYSQHRSESESAALRFQEETIASISRVTELEETNRMLQEELDSMVKDNHSISCERDRLNIRENELQEKLEIAEAKCSELHSHSESVQVRSREEFASSSLQIKGLEVTLHRLQSDYRSLGLEKDGLQRKLDDKMKELGSSVTMHSRHRSENQSATLRYQEEAIGSMVRVMELENTNHIFQEEINSIVEENHSIICERDRLNGRGVEMQEKLELMEAKYSELLSSLERVQSEYRSLESENDGLKEKLGKTVKELEKSIAMLSQRRAESELAALRCDEQAIASMSRVTELEDTNKILQEELDSLLEENRSIMSERDRLKVEGNELQRNLVLAEAKNSELHSHSESIQVRSREEIGASSQQIKGLEESVARLHSERRSLGTERDGLKRKLESTIIQLEASMAMLSQHRSESESAAVRYQEEAIALISRMTELEDTNKILRGGLDSIAEENRSIKCERDHLNSRWNELQEKLELTEAKYSELHSHSESVQARSLEETTTSSRKIKELENTLRRLQSDFQDVGKVKDSLQSKLDNTVKELETSQAINSQHGSESESAALRYQGEAIAAMSRVTELEDTLLMLREAYEASVRELEIAQKASEDAQSTFVSRQVDLENQYVLTKTQRDALSDEVTRLRQAFNLMEQANESHKARLASSEIESKELARLLDETSVMLKEAMDHKKMLEDDLTVNGTRPSKSSKTSRVRHLERE